MTTPRFLRAPASAAVAALVGTVLLAVPTATAATEPVPQAPVLPRIATTETLPFTIAGGGAVEIAVLTGTQAPASATWTTTSALDLLPYAGQSIRVLARKVGVTAPADTFDATYRVADAYPPGEGLGTSGNPFVGTPGSSPSVVAWATGWEGYQPGTNVDASWKTPANALGPVAGTGYDGNMDVVVLGDRGRITLTFDAPITDGDGDDLTVFENGFRVSGGNNDFMELGYVEVSSNGTDFARFDSASLRDAPTGGFAGFPASQLGGLAGRDLNGYGTAFDLAALGAKPAVRSGDVDLTAITHVRIIDVVGDGDDLDSFGRPILDPYPTTGSGGFDLRGVGVLNQAAPGPDRVAEAAGLLNRQARAFDEPVKTNAVTAADFLLAFAAAGAGGHAAYEGRAWYLLDALEQRTRLAPGSTTQAPVTVGGVATGALTSADDLVAVLHAAAVYDQDTTDFGGRDIRAEVGGLLAANGPESGWLLTRNGGTATATVRTQARAVLALDAAGDATHAAAAASALIGKQLGSGAFPRTFAATSADVESTAYAVHALTALGGAPATTAATAAADYLVGLQQPAGDFTGASEPALVGLVGDALTAAGRTGPAAKARAFLEGLQVLEADGVDPVYAGGIAATPARRAQLLDASFDPLNFPELVTANLRALHALAPGTLADLAVADLGSTRPAVEGNDTSHAGACTGTEGVTVVVDFAYVAPAGREEPVVRCSLGTQTSGWAAIENAGVPVSSVPGFEGGALCQLDGVPAVGYPKCWTEDGYWSYWHAEPGGLWAYSNYGASNRAPSAGSVEGWRFVPLDGTGLPPKVGPTFTAGVDTTAPVLAFTGGPEGEVASGAELAFPFSLDDTNATLECRLDQGAWVPCDPPTGWTATEQQHTLRDVPDGNHTFRVRATDHWANTTTISRDFRVTTPGQVLPATKLAVAVGAPIVLRGKAVRVTASGLAAGETYTVRLGGASLGTGTADAAGKVNRVVTVPGSLSQARRTVTVTGSTGTRTGSVALWVAAPKKLTVTPLWAKVRATYGQRVTVAGLIPGEKVVVTYAGKRATARANANGRVVVAFRVGAATGRKVVRVQGFDPAHHGSTTFTVTKRNGSSGGVKGTREGIIR